MALDSGGVIMFKILWSFLRELTALVFKICVLSEVGQGHQWLRISIIEENFGLGGRPLIQKAALYTDSV